LDSFQCLKCGACCRSLDKSIHFAEYHDGNGVCKYLDDKTNLCTIYDKRPLLCNIDKAYDAYFKAYMTREEYNNQNLNVCKLLLNN
jgi:Fe-S-cluster containining protein